MKRNKLKVKKQVWLFLIIIIIFIVVINFSKKIHTKSKYKKTTEYKLLKVGYTKDDIKILEEKTNNEIINNLINSPKNEFLLSLFKEPYYLDKNLNRYLDYNKKNAYISPKDVVSLVNTNNDFTYYDHDIEANISLNELILVNKFYRLPENYEPNNLVNVSNKYYYGENHKLTKDTYKAFIEMWNEANKEDIYLILNSSYRTFSSQVSLYDSYKNTKGTSYADSIAARPSYSERQTGLALNIFSKENISTTDFKDSPTHIWLQNNAHKFGFIERNKEGKENITGFNAEPWHYRYVGIDAATYIHENNITFEEYYAYFIEK